MDSKFQTFVMLPARDMSVQKLDLLLWSLLVTLQHNWRRASVVCRKEWPSLGVGPSDPFIKYSTVLHKEIDSNCSQQGE